MSNETQAKDGLFLTGEITTQLAMAQYLNTAKYDKTFTNISLIDMPLDVGAKHISILNFFEILARSPYIREVNISNFVSGSPYDAFERTK